MTNGQSANALRDLFCCVVLGKQLEEISVVLVVFVNVASAGAQTRYLQVIKTLAQVRWLAMPALQINLAKTQLNTAGNPR